MKSDIEQALMDVQDGISALMVEVEDYPWRDTGDARGMKADIIAAIDEMDERRNKVLALVQDL